MLSSRKTIFNKIVRKSVAKSVRISCFAGFKDFSHKVVESSSFSDDMRRGDSVGGDGKTRVVFKFNGKFSKCGKFSSRTRNIKFNMIDKVIERKKENFRRIP